MLCSKNFSNTNKPKKLKELYNFHQAKISMRRSTDRFPYYAYWNSWDEIKEEPSSKM